MPTLTQIKTGLRLIGNSYSSKIAPKLVYINFSTTSLCNLNCVMCDARLFKKEKYTSIKYDAFKKVIDESMKYGLEYINFAATGEATIHPDFPKMVDYAESKGLKMRLVTNLTIVNDKILNALSKFDQIHVSIDGCTKETYEKIRRGAKWNKLIENVKKLRLLLPKKSRFIVNFCVQKDNLDEIPILADTFIQLGFDNINVGWMMDQSSMHIDQKINKWDKLLDLAKKAEKGFEKYKLPVPRVLDPKILEKARPMKDPSQFLRLGYNVKDVPCYHYHFNLFITPNGNVYPCCFFEYNEGLTGQKVFSVGNVYEQGMDEIWMGEKIQSMRKSLLQKKFVPTCEHCSNKINCSIHEKLGLVVKK